MIDSTKVKAAEQLNSLALAAVDSESLRRLAFCYHVGGDYVVEAAFREQTAAALRRLYNHGRRPGDEIAFNALMAIFEGPDVVPGVLRLVRDYHARNKAAFEIAAAAHATSGAAAECDGQCVIRRTNLSRN